MNICEPSKQKKLVCLDFGKKRTLRNLTTPTLVIAKILIEIYSNETFKRKCRAGLPNVKKGTSN